VILFNEILYYPHNPIDIFKRFERRLKPDGFFAFSMFKKRNPFA